ncbi:D-serine ammonia-lyase [Desulforhopalus sp. IMCC35007]|uniref:D-serine ammonia-lyase n=1 Tax=Desulforhopalus sp. IMCC35007 TaxID=2569543 RepID=UPI0010AEBA32|nr:D-serine ammonia-lyase [Desulforhopalus sp. IMCC35007]TKB06519.1 D-serine ammonia-lyase [Desulforhopalus sp. IMCC35007]
MGNSIQDKTVKKWVQEQPILEDVAALRPVFWLNQGLQPFTAIEQYLAFTLEDVRDAALRLERFRPYLIQAFPETMTAAGKIESPLRHIPAFQHEVSGRGATVFGDLFIKLDSHLPISGSIKARGGIYEILKLAENIAVEKGLLELTGNYEAFHSRAFGEVFSQYSIVVGSTGNLGLSIGIIGKKLGFNVTVHMSADARRWKKEMLRSLGVCVVEHKADYSVAVSVARKEAGAQPFCHFVDDEKSRDLFLGYAVAGERLKNQLVARHIIIDEAHPLFVYLPCGVGGGPGGVAFGLKLAFGDNVYCFFGEPTQAPAMLLGLVTGLHDGVSATEFGIENTTAADGLAVSRPSGLVSRTMQYLLSGAFTVADDEMYRLLALLSETENIRLEPSGVVGGAGYLRIPQIFDLLPVRCKQENVTHLIWATGGSMVPDAVWQQYFTKGKEIIENECM